MTAPAGARGHPLPAHVQFSLGKEFNYMAAAEAIVGRGKPLEEFTRDEERQALKLAIAQCRADGVYPERQERNPPVECINGHEHPSGSACRDCQRIERQARNRKRPTRSQREAAQRARRAA